jgi:cytohesin
VEASAHLVAAVKTGACADVDRLLRGDAAQALGACGGVPLVVLALQHRQAGVARLLVERGADPNARGSGGTTPLHAAADAGDRAVAELLVERGADPSSRDDRGHTPGELALAGGHGALAEWLCGLMAG